MGDFRGSLSANFTAGRAKAFWAPLENWETFTEWEGRALSPTASHTFCPAWKASLPETHHFTPSVCCWETWLKGGAETHIHSLSLSMTLTTPQVTVFVLAAWVPRVNAAVHWSLSDKATGVVCMVPYGFHSTQASPFQWAVVELMWDMLRQSRPLGFGLSAVCSDALLWNSQAQAALKVFYTSLTTPLSFSHTSRWVKQSKIDARLKVLYFYLLPRFFFDIFLTSKNIFTS